MSGAIITACEETRRLPEVIESYKLRISTLQAKIRENEARMTEQERTHRRDKLDSSARFRQKEVDLAHEFREKEARLKADFDKEVQMWRTKFQTAQDSGNNAANALHAQLR
jgi:Na+-translocating ferredoxin:NAD+ oxidoreductase RnfC subunit